MLLKLRAPTDGIKVVFLCELCCSQPAGLPGTQTTCSGGVAEESASFRSLGQPQKGNLCVPALHTQHLWLALEGRQRD